MLRPCHHRISISHDILKSSFLISTAFLLYSCSESQQQQPKKEQAVQYAACISPSLLTDYLRQAKRQELQTSTYREPFSGLPFNKVIAYDFDGDEEKYPSVIDPETGSFNPVVLRQKELNKGQIENVVTFLTASSTYGEGIAACFVPHFSLVFYLDDKAIFEAAVCLDCNYLLSTTEIPAAHVKKIITGDSTESDAIGFSKEGKMAIINLCKELGFGYATYK